jgi:hypothetical protein
MSTWRTGDPRWDATTPPPYEASSPHPVLSLPLSSWCHCKLSIPVAIAHSPPLPSLPPAPPLPLPIPLPAPSSCPPPSPPLPSALVHLDGIFGSRASCLPPLPLLFLPRGEGRVRAAYLHAPFANAGGRGGSQKHILQDRRTESGSSQGHNLALTGAWVLSWLYSGRGESYRPGYK